MSVSYSNTDRTWEDSSFKKCAKTYDINKGSSVVGHMFPMCRTDQQYSNKIHESPKNDTDADIEFDYCPDNDISFGETSYSNGLTYNDHNYSVPTGITPPSSPPHLRNAPLNLTYCQPAASSTDYPTDTYTSEQTLNQSKAKGFEVTVSSSKNTGGPELEIAPSDFELPSAFEGISNWERNLRGGCLFKKDQYPSGLNIMNLQGVNCLVEMETDMKVIEVPEDICVSPSDLSDLDSDFDEPKLRKPTVPPKNMSYWCAELIPDNILSIKEEPQVDFEVKVEQIDTVDDIKAMPRGAVVRCACGYMHDDHKMIMCTECTVWQHQDCMISPSTPLASNEYKCEICCPRSVNFRRATEIQMTKQKLESMPSHLRLPYIKQLKLATQMKVNSNDSGPITKKIKVKQVRIKKEPVSSGVFDSQNTSIYIPSPPRNSKRKQDFSSKSYMDVVNVRQAHTVSQEQSTNQEQSIRSQRPSSRRLQSSSSTADIPSDQEVSQEADTKPLPASHAAPASARLWRVQEDNDVKPSLSPPRRKQKRGPPRNLEKESDPFVRGQSMDTISNPQSSAWAQNYTLVDDNTYTQSFSQELTLFHQRSQQNVYTMPPNYLTRSSLCRIVLFDINEKGIEAACCLKPGEVITEYRGNVMLLSEYEKFIDIYHEPPVNSLIYRGLDSIPLVVDASEIGNPARYVRRSCRPTCELDHVFVGNGIHILLKAIASHLPGSEVTIPFDVDYMTCRYPVKCACSKSRCPVTRWSKRVETRRVSPKYDYSRYIESQLRVLSKPMNNTSSSTSKQPSLLSTSRSSTYSTGYLSSLKANYDLKLDERDDDREDSSDYNAGVARNGRHPSDDYSDSPPLTHYQTRHKIVS